jgi:O-antigen/teichoic acid export membrane protein
MAKVAAVAGPIAPRPLVGARRWDALRAVARGGSFVLGATLLWNLSNFAFNAVGARALGPSGYGQLAAVVALLYVVSPLLYALQATASGTAARLTSTDRDGDVRPQLRRQAWRAAGWTAFVVAVAALAAGQIAHALRLSSSIPVLLLFASMPLAAIVNLQRGAMQGIGHFERYAASTTIEAGAKIILAGALLLLWPHVESAVLATAAALGCAALAHTRLLGVLPAAAPTGQEGLAAGRNGALALACLVLLAVLLSGDVIAARHGMGSHASGVYAAVSLAGKIVFFATSGLTWVLFPMLSARDERGEDGRKLLLGAVTGVTIVAAVVAGIEWIAPSLVIIPLAGHGYEAAGPWLAPAACAFAPYAVAYVLGMGLAARRRTSAAIVLAGAAAAQVLGFVLITPTVGHLLAINACAFSVAALGLAVLCLREGTP